MLDITGQSAANPEKQPAQQAGSHMMLRMEKHERMGGSVPVWVNVSGPAEESAGPKGTFSQALGLQTTQDIPSAAGKETPAPFGFGDLVDMVNPLQHIPFVGQVYRNLTGDEIRPVSKIIGGGVYGGIAGAAGSLAGVIVEEETGKDITGNAVALVLHGEGPEFKSTQGKPEQMLTEALKHSDSATLKDLPGSVLSFADLGGGRRMVYERMPVAEGRTAGTMVRKYIEHMPAPALPPREAISTLDIETLLAFEGTRKDNV